MQKWILSGALSLSIACGTQHPSSPPASTPTAQPLAFRAFPQPNVMLLVDKSGSMDLPIRSDETCGSCRGDDCPQSSCPTRWAELRNAMDAFLSDPASATSARYGLAMFPELLDESSSTVVNTCNGTTAPRLVVPHTNDQPNELASAASRALEVIKSIKSPGGSEALRNGTGGGTPTSKSLMTVGGHLAASSASDFEERSNVIVLLTDGEPNCNEDNSFSYSSDPDACQCSVFTGSAPACSFADYDRRGCRDSSASVDAVRELLLDKKVRTVVIGFGAEMAGGSAADTMNRMAAAGGLARRCDANGQCGANDSCVQEKVCGGDDPRASGLACDSELDCPGSEACAAASHCARKFYLAQDSVELTAALQEIARSVTSDNCEFELATSPEDASRLTVKLNGLSVQTGADTWTVEGATLTFHGAACDLIVAGTVDDPTQVTIAIVR